MRRGLAATPGWLLRRVVRLVAWALRLPLVLPAWLADALPRRRLLVLQLAEQVADRAQPGAWRRWLPGPDRLALDQALGALEEARGDRRIPGALLLLDRPALELVQAEQLLAALQAWRAAGKQLVVWLDGSSGPNLLLSAAADRALGTPLGEVEFLGLRARAVFLRGLLDAVGVVPDLQHVGDYKTAPDALVLRGQTEPGREMLTELGRDISAQLLDPVAARRGLAAEALVELLGQAPLANSRAVEAGLLDGVAYLDQARVTAGELVGLGKEPTCLTPGTLLARRRRRQGWRDVWRDRPRLAVLHLRGAIGPGEDGRGCPANPALRALDALREDQGVAAVVLRIDSPGGSALASDAIWRGVKRLDGEKPVVASLARVAASGGYYIAVGARRIVAHAGTLTGSIGVFGGKLHLGPLLRRLGIHSEAIDLAPRAGLQDPDRGYDPAERAAVAAELERIYQVFLERVAEGRRRTREEVHAVAQGRVYTGRRALELGLVDRLGGLEAALEEAATLAGVSRPWRVEHHQPERHGWGGLLGEQARSGPWAALEPLELLLRLSHEPALAWCPWQLEGI